MSEPFVDTTPSGTKPKKPKKERDIKVKGKRHFGKTVVDTQGLSPTVRDNHGDSPARVETNGD